MNPIVSLVTKVEVATEVVAMARVVDVDGAATVDGACHSMGILWWLRLQVSPHHCGSNKETSLMDHHWWWRQEGW